MEQADWGMTRQVVISEFQIDLGVRSAAVRLGEIFKHEYFLSECPTFISILHGGRVFCHDLMDKVNFIHYHETIEVKSYKGEVRGGVEFVRCPKLDEGYKKIILVDDFCDSGSTLVAVKNYFEKEYGSKVYCVTFLKRKSTKFDDLIYCHEIDGDDWLYGYGLDNNGLDREVREIYKLIK